MSTAGIRTMNICTRLLVASLAIACAGQTRAATLEDFFGTWEVVGESCASSSVQTEGDWFSIGRGAISYGSGGVCSDVIMKQSGRTLSVTAHCVFEEADQSTPMAEQFTVDRGQLIRPGGEGTQQRYERCDGGDDGLSVFSPTDNRPRCSPKDNTARILAKPEPYAIHPNWSDGFLGTSFSIALDRTLRTVSGTYLQGDLYTPRGNLTERGVFAVAAEWQCPGD